MSTTPAATASKTNLQKFEDWLKKFVTNPIIKFFVMIGWATWFCLGVLYVLTLQGNDHPILAFLAGFAWFILYAIETPLAERIEKKRYSLPSSLPFWIVEHLIGIFVAWIFAYYADWWQIAFWVVANAVVLAALQISQWLFGRYEEAILESLWIVKAAKWLKSKVFPTAGADPHAPAAAPAPVPGANPPGDPTATTSPATHHTTH